MKYFDLLEIYGIIENFRLKKANIIRLFLYNKSLFLVNTIKKNLSKEYFFISPLIVCALISTFFSSLDFQRFIFFDNQLFPASFYFDKATYLPYLIDDILSNLAKKFSLNILLIAKIFWLLCGLLTIYFSGSLLKKNDFKISLIEQNLLLISFAVCYFFSFNYEISALENSKNFFILLLTVYLPLLLIKNNNKYLILVYIIALGFMLLKSELIILILCYEILALRLYFQGKNGNRAKLILQKILTISLRLLLLIIVYYLILEWVFGVNFFESVSKSFNSSQFYNFKFYNSQFIQAIYNDQNNRGYFFLLSRDLMLVIVSLFAYHKIIFDDLKTSFFNHKIFVLFGLFFSNIFLSFFYNNFLIKDAIKTINLIIIFQIFFDLIIGNKINLKKNAIVLLIFVSLALGDHNVFFDLFFYLPMLWFVILVVLGVKLRSKIFENKTLQKLNFLESFFLLKNRQSIIFFIIFVFIFLTIEFLISYFIASIIAILILLLMINSYHNINKKVLASKYCYFLSILVIVISFAYFFIPKFAIFGYKNTIEQNLILEKKLLQETLAKSISKKIKGNDNVLLITKNSRSLANLKIFFLNNKLSFNNNFSFNKYSEIIFDNSPRIDYDSCNISDFEDFLRINEEFFLKNKYQFYKKIYIIKKLSSDYHFKKNNLGLENAILDNNINFYEYLIFTKD